ncbi:MAG: hypothetical protein WD028_11050 [Balneolaceae bacterium]
MASQTLHPATAGPVIQALEQRKTWEHIKQDYELLRKTHKTKEAILLLSERYHYSEKTIESVIYR